MFLWLWDKSQFYGFQFIFLAVGLCLRRRLVEVWLFPYLRKFSLLGTHLLQLTCYRHPAFCQVLSLLNSLTSLASLTICSRLCQSFLVSHLFSGSLVWTVLWLGIRQTAAYRQSLAFWDWCCTLGPRSSNNIWNMEYIYIDQYQPLELPLLNIDSIKEQQQYHMFRSLINQITTKIL